ncbi:MAG: uracil-DNA glycosylase family protein [bacterium]
MPPRKTTFTRDPSFAARVLEATARLRDEAGALRFGDPVAWVYNPLQYAWDLHRQYVERWGASPRKVLMLGMNPGPWGMAQTGVPFGEVGFVKGWLGLDAPVGKPVPEHPKRPVLGLDCPRSEVSGRRLWGFFAETFGAPERFFTDHVIVNYCPLVFMEEGARNRTPDKLSAPEAAPLFAACDRRLTALVDLYRPRFVLGVGAFARGKLEVLFGRKAAGGPGGHVPEVIGQILHPSPASPAANRGWAEAAGRQFAELGVWD